MRILFVDESHNSNEDSYLVAGLMLDGPGLSALETGLRLVKKEMSEYGVSPDAELHGYPLFHGKDDWAPLHGKPRLQIRVFRESFRVVCSSNALVFFSSTSPSKLAAASPHELALRYLLEQADRVLEEAPDYAVVICDDVDDAAQQRSFFNLHKSIGTGGYKSRPLDRLLDTMHFADSRNSLGLQAVDLLAFLERRRRFKQPQDQREKSAMQLVFNELGGDSNVGGCIAQRKHWPIT